MVGSTRRIALLALSAVTLLLVPAASSRSFADATPPTLSIGNITTPATYGCGQSFCANVPYAYDVSDPDDTPDQITVTCNSASGSPHTAGQGVVTCQARDAAGNLSPPVMFTVVVTIPIPTFQGVPAPITVAATSSQGAVVTFTPPTAVDVAQQPATVDCDHPSGSAYPIGTTTVTCTAQIKRNDSVGNSIPNLPSATAQFAITVEQQATGSSGGGAGGGDTGGGGGDPGSGVGSVSPDTTAPQFAPHANITVPATTRRGARVTYAVVASDSDNPLSTLSVGCSPAPGSLFHLAAEGMSSTTVVTCSASDPNGNTAEPLSFRVTVLGIHSQLLALEQSVRVAKWLSKTRRAELLATLVLADRYYGAEATRKLRTQLRLFITRTFHLPVSRHQEPTLWLAAAHRVLSVSN